MKEFTFGNAGYLMALRYVWNKGIVNVQEMKYITEHFQRVGGKIVRQIDTELMSVE